MILFPTTTLSTVFQVPAVRTAATTLLLVISLFAGAQTPEALNRDSRSDQIEKARNLLLDEVVHADKHAVSDITRHLLSLEDQHYLSLYPGERWLIHYWLEEYDEVLAGVAQYQSNLRGSPQTKILPAEGYLFTKLREMLNKERMALLFRISESGRTAKEKEFLSLNLNYLLAGYGDNDISRETLNDGANAFLSHYPDSEYERFIREYIHYEYVASKWGFGCEFFSGYGMFTDDLAAHFNNNVPFGIAFDVSFKRWVLFLRDYIGFTRTTHPIVFSEGTWKEHAQARVFLPEATLGYVIRDLKRVKVIPFAGISSTSVTPTQNDLNKYEEYENVGLDFTTTFSYGVNVDFKLGSAVPANAVGQASYTFLRLRYSFNQPRFGKKYEGYSGNMHCITVGVGVFGRRLKREL